MNFYAVIEKSKQHPEGGTYDQAMQLYTKMSRRIKSRMNKRGLLPGHLWLVSSARHPNDFTERKEIEAQTDKSISIHATPGDLLSNFRFGLMGFTEARRKWLILNTDLMWVRLGTSKALPFPGLEAISADVKGGEFLLSPKVGVRILNRERIKIDALTGFRYWHFYESVKFVPTNLNISFSKSQDWVDPVVGGKITGTLAPKVLVTIFGDAGGWGTGSQLEYQVGGALGYKIKPKWTLQAGYRYLYVNYRNGRAEVEMVTSGALMGVTINLK